MAAVDLWRYGRGDGPDAVGSGEPTWPCCALARTDTGPSPHDGSTGLVACDTSSDEKWKAEIAEFTARPELEAWRCGGQRKII
jgi:hypothetical protein